jgi:DNA-binding response OmpR family regulator
MDRAKLLVADDDDVTLTMLDAALSAHHDVVAVTGGQAALVAAQKDPFDLVLLDVDMPDLDGYAACQALKAQAATADVPVLFLSARVNLDERLKGYRVGASDYLTKPFEVAELHAKIALAVEQRARQRALSGQLDEAMNAVMSTADMYGEVGVVLNFQRRLAECRHYRALAEVFFDTLGQMGLDGCLRLVGRAGVWSSTARAECSALENSLLDHIEQAKGPSIQAVGHDNTSYNYGSVVMLVRGLPLLPSPGQHDPDTIERLARARDNVALLAEGLVARMRALDAENQHHHAERSSRLVALTREALVDISAQQHANRMHLEQVFQRLRAAIEASYIHLGLSEVQEELLSDTVQRHLEQAMAVFDQSNEIEAHMSKLIRSLNGDD